MKWGLASYTLREFNLEETISMTKRIGIDNISLKSMHLPYDLDSEEIKRRAQTVRDGDLNFYGVGVIYMGSKEEVDQGFNYGQDAGVDTIIGAPNPEILEIAEDRVKEYDIKLAIHNHGPESENYSGAKEIYEKIEGFDEKIGICLDIGHIKRIGRDPSKVMKKYSNRVLDIHIKDVSEATEEGYTVPINQGVIDIPGFLKTVQNCNYNGILSIEFEEKSEDPMPEIAESIGFLKGATEVM